MRKYQMSRINKSLDKKLSFELKVKSHFTGAIIVECNLGEHNNIVTNDINGNIILHYWLSC